MIVKYFVGRDCDDIIARNNTICIRELPQKFLCHSWSLVEVIVTFHSPLRNIALTAYIQRNTGIGQLLIGSRTCSLQDAFLFSGATLAVPFITRNTVDAESPASFATSRMLMIDIFLL